jgi:vancomycin resistance protein YoaR
LLAAGAEASINAVAEALKAVEAFNPQLAWAPPKNPQPPPQQQAPPQEQNPISQQLGSHLGQQLNAGNLNDAVGFLRGAAWAAQQQQQAAASQLFGLHQNNLLQQSAMNLLASTASSLANPAQNAGIPATSGGNTNIPPTAATNAAPNPAQLKQLLQHLTQAGAANITFPK